jgi:hypothetical protein
MTLVGTAMTRLADFREEVLHEQSPVEARKMRALARQLRRVLLEARLSRRQFAERARLPLELIVSIENGYGRPLTAKRVLNLARAWLEHS